MESISGLAVEPHSSRSVLRAGPYAAPLRVLRAVCAGNIVRVTGDGRFSSEFSNSGESASGDTRCSVKFGVG